MSIPPICSWFTGMRKKALLRCEKTADWQGPSCRPQGWLLCDEHFQLLINSYNDKSQKEERPKWKKIKTP